MPERRSQKPRGNERDPGCISLLVQQFIHHPDSCHHGCSADQSRPQPERKRRDAQDPHPESGPIEECYLLACIRGDEDGPCQTLRDLASQNAVGCLVVMETCGKFRQPVESQSRRDEDDEQECCNV